jgi:biopolymer transport protein ExbD
MYLGQNQILAQTRIQSELGNKSLILQDAQAANSKKLPESSLTLTSLVDCFTTILVYLLLASTFGAVELDTPNDMQLPHAFHSMNLENGVVLRVDHGRYVLDNKLIPLEKLVDALAVQKTKTGVDFVVVQADKSTRFSQVNPAVLSGLQAGFKQVRFAVLQEDEK